MKEYYFSHMSEREIPVFCEDFAYGERLYGSEPGYNFYECPVTGENILAQEHPEELLVYYDNLDGGITHLNENYQSIYDEYIETEYASDSDFIAYLVDRLPSDMPLYHLIISHPQGVSGDFVELLYKGVYDREWIPICDDDVEFEEEEEEVIETPLHSKDDVLAAIEKNGGTVNANLKDFSLIGIDLSGMDLRGVNLENANLSKANLSNTNLEGAILISSKLHRTIFSETNLRDANLSKSDMICTIFNNSDISHADFTAARARHIELTNTKAKNTKFNSAELTQITIKVVDFQGSSLVHTRFDSGDYTGADFSNCNFDSADISRAGFSESNFNNAFFNNLNNFCGVLFHECSFVGATITNSQAWCVEFSNVDLTNANLTSMQFNDSNLTGANLTGADVTNTSFDDTDLTDAILKDVDFSKATVSNRWSQ